MTVEELERRDAEVLDNPNAPYLDRVVATAKKVPDGAGGYWLLDANDHICGGLSFATYPDLNRDRQRDSDGN